MPSSEPLLDTSTSFVQRLGQRDPVAWDQFATKYEWMMRRWMQAWDIPIDDVDDILQETLIRVLENVHRFARRGPGTFRVWLKKVSRNCWLQSVRQAFHRARKSQLRYDLESCLSESTMRRIDSEIDELIAREALDFAIRRARQECNDKSWEAYRLMAIERLSGAEAAKTLGISIDLAYKGKDRFERQLKVQMLSFESVG